MLDVITMRDLWQESVDGYLPILLEIYNADIAWTAEEKAAYGQEDAYLRLIADVNKVNYKGKTYLPCTFDYSAPEVDGSKVGSASLTITALDSRIKKLIRSIKLPSEVKVTSIFMREDKEGNNYIYKFKPLDMKPFTMTTASTDGKAATFNLGFRNFGGTNVPYDVATSDRTPGVKE